MRDGHRPQRPRPQERLQRHPRPAGGGRRNVRRACRQAPWQQPERGHETEQNEDGPPTVGAEDQAACQRPESRPQRNADRNRGIGHAAALGRNLLGNDLAACGESKTASDPEQRPQDNQRDEAGDEPAQQSRDGPKAHAPGQQAVNREAVAQPAHDQLKRSVHPEEGRDRDAIFERRQRKGVLHQRRRNADRAAVYVIQENRSPEQENEHSAGRWPHAGSVAFCGNALAITDDARRRMRGGE